MCLAIPMRVVELKGSSDDLLNPPIATVETDGIRKEVRLDLVDKLPNIGDYVVIHAGFAVNCLDAENAETNLKLLRELAASTDEPSDGNNV